MARSLHSRCQWFFSWAQMGKLSKKNGSSKKYWIPVKKPVYERTDSEAVKVRSSKEWQNVRAAAFARMPLCCDPLGRYPNQAVPTEEIHHIEPLRVAPEKAFLMSNLAGLCKPCHREVEARLRKGLEVKFSANRFIL